MPQGTYLGCADDTCPSLLSIRYIVLFEYKGMLSILVYKIILIKEQHFVGIRLWTKIISVTVLSGLSFE